MKQNMLVSALGLGLIAMMASATSAAQEQPNPSRVWVKFKNTPAVGAAAKRQGLSVGAVGLQQRVQLLRDKLATLNSGDAVLNYQFDKLNTAVMTLPSPQAIEALRNNPDVESVTVDAPRYLQAQSTPYGIDQVQARDVWDANRDGVIDVGAATGAGVKVCVIDSGINRNHEDFAGIAITGYPTGWDSDTCGHGTHVAGTIAAANNSTGVVGVSPGKVSLHIIKLFGANEYGQCKWVYSSTLVDAATRCEAAGAKIINMSLGGGAASTAERTAFQGLADRGVLSIAAAGNDGNSTQSYPASYPSVVSVAAVDQNSVKADFSQFNAEVDLAAPGVDTQSTVPEVDDPLAVGNARYAITPIAGAKRATVSAGWVNGGLCKTSSTTWRNKIVLCQRGEIAFLDKAKAVASGRGLGMVVYNNVAGTIGAGYSDASGNPITHALPAVTITQADGQAIIASGTGQTVTIDSIPSVSNTAYGTKSGTSMATPHVSGVAALVWSAKPAATAAQVRDALLVTAKDIDVAGRDDNTGWGLVQAKDAIVELQSH